jgi:hypothetical protein
MIVTVDDDLAIRIQAPAVLFSFCLSVAFRTLRFGSNITFPMQGEKGDLGPAISRPQLPLGFPLKACLHVINAALIMPA